MNDLVAEFLRGMSRQNAWGAILPEIALGVLALALLAVDLFAPRARNAWVPRIAIGGQAIVLVGLLGALPGQGFGREATVIFNGMLQQSDFGQIARVFVLVSSILVCYLGTLYLRRQALPRTEFYHLVLIIAGGMMLLVQSSHFVMLFVALETVTVGFYVMVAYCRTSTPSLEGGFKYLVMGAVSSAILLFGIVLLYGVGGAPGTVAAAGDPLAFSGLYTFIAHHGDNSIVRLGALMVLAGVFFKIGAFPFQIWVPDVYQGAPTPVAAFLAVASKGAGFVVLLNLVTGPFLMLEDLLVPVLGAVAGATILFGNIAAVNQRNVKRLMGLSGIAHAGYMLVGVVAAWQVPWAHFAVLFYLATYLLASFAVFGVMSLVADKRDDAQELEHYDDLAKDHPFLGAALGVGLGSLAGIPPLAGFIGKLFIFVAAYQAQLYGLLAVAILGVAISIYYYFGWMREAYFRTTRLAPEAPRGPIAVGRIDRLTLGALLLATIVVGVFPGVLPIVP